MSLLGGTVGQAGAAVRATDNGGSQNYRYDYVSLDNAVPPGALFADYFKVTDSGRVYGNSFVCGPITCDPSIVVYKKGAVTVIHSGGAFGYTANESGVVGGSVVTDPVNFVEQAALFVGSLVTLIPRVANESTSHVVKITNSGIALVASVAATGAISYYVYGRGRPTRLNLGADQVLFPDINDSGTVSGTYYLGAAKQFRAFRYSLPSGPPQLLSPLPTEHDSWGQAINSEGDVLGYSFVGGALERIGYWKRGTFNTSFVEGTPAFPTVSNRLLWNEHRLIVITDSRNDNNSYIVPEPGVRLNVADLTAGLPVWTKMVDVNNKGDLIGFGGQAYGFSDHTFLLKRTHRS